MRSQASLGKSIPVTTRNLESLIRLGQARARAELRETVTEQDAKDVVDLLHESLLDAFTAESGELGGGPGGELGLYTKAGTMRGATHQMKALVTALKEESRAMDGKRIFHTNEIAALCQRLKLEKPPTELIDKLHSENYLLQKPNKSFELSFV
jgi:DNA helicase MCM8